MSEHTPASRSTSGYAKKIESLIEQRDSLRAVNAELIKALEFYANPGDYKGNFTGGMGRLYFDCGEKARAAIASARKQGEQG